MNPKLSKLYHRYVAATFDKQRLLSERIGERGWRFNMDRGTLSFGQDLRWAVQILGTESEGSGTWRWAWANEASGIPAGLLRMACAMKELGEREGLAELTTPEIPVNEINGHYLAALTTGVLDAAAYYRGPYPGGAVFLLICDESYGRPKADPIPRILATFPQAIAAYPIDNHREAFDGYLHYYGLAGRAEGPQIVVERDGQTVLTATFDELNRLITLEGRLGPNEANVAKRQRPWWRFW